MHALVNIYCMHKMYTLLDHKITLMNVFEAAISQNGPIKVIKQNGPWHVNSKTHCWQCKEQFCIFKF